MNRPRKMKDGKVKNTKKTMKNMMGLLKPYRIRFIIVLIFALASTIFSVIGPKIMGNATSVLFEGLMARVQGTGGVDFDRIGQIIMILIGIYIISVLFSIVQGFIMAGVSRNLTYNLRKSIHAKVEKLPLKYFDKRSVGDVLSLMTNDIDVIDSNLTSTLTNFITSVTTIVG
ncbi:MAG: ABC transporter ATP-binding protein, partial [Erysipelothrix sp.]|nr:ABC transporter ATP-binding protein [Erysipelothrix sp.]